MKRNRWTEEDINILMKSVFESLTIEQGCKKASSRLSGRHSVASCRVMYHRITNTKKKNYVKPEINVVEVIKVEKPKSLIEQLQEVAKNSKEVYDAVNILIDKLNNFKF